MAKNYRIFRKNSRGNPFAYKHERERERERERIRINN